MGDRLLLIRIAFTLMAIRDEADVFGDCTGTTGTAGYKSTINYEVRSFFNVSFYPFYFNETFADVTDVYIGNDWPDYQPIPNTAIVSGFADGICFADPTHTPRPTVPQMPLSTTQIDFGLQGWSIGSLQTGGGILIQTDTLNRFIDHATHTVITSPVR
jgi:hypothetical protein